MYRIVRKEALKPTVILYEIEAPMVAKKAEPGQFIILRVDENGERIPITIHDFDREKGTVTIIVQTIGATTDLDGSFSVRIGARTDVRLIVSYLGLKTREVAVDDPARFYEVRLENDNMALDEVVVVGYGTQRRSLVTNAISQFKPTEENMRSVMSPSELLQGRIAGVSISTSSGNLGSAEKMSIRGSSSLSASNEPLYVIDGIPLSNNSASLYSFGENMSSLATLNLTDIESIEVLKDAASAAIYGARASNGVIIVTTKKGSPSQGPQVVFDVQVGFSAPTKKWDLLSSREQIALVRPAIANIYAKSTGTLAASLLDMDFKSSVIAVMCGVVLAGVIMGLLSMGVFGALGTIF